MILDFKQDNSTKRRKSEYAKLCNKLKSNKNTKGKSKHLTANTYASCGRNDPARKRRLNRISFADLRFPLAGTRSMRVEKKNVVMEKATASTSSATIVAERERQNKEQRELSAVDFLQEHS